MRAKSFLYASLGILALAAAYHLGASTAIAQAPNNAVVGINGNEVVTANGDVYSGSGYSNGVSTVWVRVSNVFSGGATPTTTQSFGALKAKYR